MTPPIIEVSGRLYPVEVHYQPLDAASEDRGEISYVDAAAQAAERILYESNFGDILIFMPGERDIRETGDQLEARFRGEAEIIPLFGRLSAGEQQRVFSPSSRRKIVIATNIAETSLTIPGIRYVIDSGLARISRYNPAPAPGASPSSRSPKAAPTSAKAAPAASRKAFASASNAEDDFTARPPSSPSPKSSAPTSPRSFCA